MAAAASSLRGQAQDLVQAVAFFQLGGTVAQPARTQVRSSVPKAIPFKGAERRNEDVSAAARKSSASTKAPAKTSGAMAKAAPKANGAGDDDWETF